MVGTEDVRLFCNGYYAEVIIMNPFTLEVIFSLSSRVNPDWISALYVLKPHTCKGNLIFLSNYTNYILNLNCITLLNYYIFIRFR